MNNNEAERVFHDSVRGHHGNLRKASAVVFLKPDRIFFPNAFSKKKKREKERKRERERESGVTLWGGRRLLFHVSYAVQPSPVQHDIRNLPFIWPYT